MKKTSAKSALTLALSSLFLAACGGGGGDDSSDKMVTSAGGASTLERVVIFELDGSPPSPILAGTHFKATVRVICGAAAREVCPEPVQVSGLKSPFGTIVQVDVDRGDKDQRSYIGQQQGAYFTATNMPMVFERSGTVEVYVLTSVQDVTPVARQWTLTIINSSAGSLVVEGFQEVQVVTRPATVL